LGGCAYYSVEVVVELLYFALVTEPRRIDTVVAAVAKDSLQKLFCVHDRQKMESEKRGD
jgi:hypothetical protein